MPITAPTILTVAAASITIASATPTALTQTHRAPPAISLAPTNDTEDFNRNTREWDLPRSKLAIDGYDPVAYFPEGGRKARKGKKSITATHDGVTYRFTTQQNKDRFLDNPNRYEPAHGLWCSWAMTEGDKTEPDPTNFIVKDDRLFLFYKGFWGDTKKQWQDGNHDQLARSADTAWKRISGEEKRAVEAN